MKLLSDWVTVPIRIQCEKDQKKLLYPKDWTHRNEFDDFTNANGLAVKTGKESDLTVIDVDSEEALNEIQKRFGINLFNASNYIVKTKKGWHFYFKYNPSLKTTTNYKGIKGFDIRNDVANVIIEVPDNLSCASYQVIKESDILTDLPEQLIYINTHQKQSSPIIKGIEVVKERAKYPLALLVNELNTVEFVNGKLRGLTDKAKSALRRLTPISFRNGEAGEHYRTIFERKGYIEPNDIMDGDGSTYLSRVAAILAADETIDYQTYYRTLTKLNQLWQNPMPSDRLEKTIIKNGNITIDGNSIWQHNPNWQDDYKATSKVALMKNDGLTLFFEPQQDKYIVFDEHSNQLFAMKKQAFAQYLLSTTGEPFKEWRELPIKLMTFNPLRLEREYSENGVEYFNTFQISPLLALAAKKEQPKKRPDFILRIIENLIPNPDKRALFLKWLGYWFTTRKKSLVSWVFISPQGAGKGILTDLIIANIVGLQFCSLEVGEDLLESQFTNWLKDKMFVSFNEINTLTKDRYKNRNKIKRLVTGEVFQLRQMGVGAYDYPNFANFIFSSNDAVPIDIEDTDRRFNVSISTQPLKGQGWFDNVTDIRAKVLEELPDFVRYVSTLDTDEKIYNTVIDDSEKAEIIADNRSPLDNFVVSLAVKNLEYFDIELSGMSVHDTYLRKLQNSFEAGQIDTTFVFDLKNAILPTINLSKTKLSRLMKRRGFETVVKKQNGVSKRVYVWKE